MEIAQVVWEDSWSEHVRMWSDKEVKEEGPLTIKSAGLLIQDDERGVALAGDYNIATDTYRSVHFIPRAMVRLVVVMKEPVD